MSALFSALINQRCQGNILVGYGQLDLACFSIISSDIFVADMMDKVQYDAIGLLLL